MAPASSTTKTGIMAASSNKRSKKRVRFEYEEGEVGGTNNESRQVKRRIVEISFPKSSLLTLEEKERIWLQPDDHRNTLYDVMALMDECHNPSCDHNDSNSTTSSKVEANKDDDPNRVPFSQYAEALAVTFTLCDTPADACHDDDHDHDDEDDDAVKTAAPSPPLWNIRNSQSVGQLALWASCHTSTRGVESKMLPGLQNERSMRRIRLIQGVLEAQSQFQQQQAQHPAQLSISTADEKMTFLSTVSRSLSHSAKQFATALAVVDGTQAYLEYTSSSSSSSDKDKASSTTRPTTYTTNNGSTMTTPAARVEGTNTTTSSNGFPLPPAAA